MATFAQADGTFSGRSNFFLRVDVTLRQTDSANNRSLWRWSLQVVNPGQTSQTWDAGVLGWTSVTVNGVIVRDSPPPSGTYDFRDGAISHSIGEGTIWINHNSDGNKTFQFTGGAANAGIFGNANASGWISANRIPKVPSAPPRPVLTSTSPTAIGYTFSSPSDNGGVALTTYTHQISLNSSFTSGVQTWDDAGSPAARGGLEPGTPYFIRYRAVNPVGSGPWSTTLSTSTDPTTPSTPPTPTLNSRTHNSIVFTRNASSDNGGASITNYQFQQATNSSFSGATTWDSTSSSQTRSGLADDTTYYYRVRAENSVGYSGWSGTLSVTTYTVPNAPGTPSLTSIAASSVKVSWTAPSDNGGMSVTGYQVQRATNSGFTSGVSTVDLSSGGSLTGLAQGTSYWVRVRAENAAGFGPWSSASSFTTLDVPDAPTNLATSNVAPTSVRLTWSAPSNNGSSITSYTVQRATNSSFTSGATTFTLSSGGTATGLAEREQYWFRVRATNGVGTGGWSSAVTATTTGHPTAPRSLTATPSGTQTGRIALSWTAPLETGTGGIVGYTIYRNGVKIATTSGTGTAYTDTGRVPYTNYSYTVTARNAYSTSVSGESPDSNAASAVAPGPPSPPRNFAIVNDTTLAGTVHMSWSAPLNAGAGGVTGYRIRRSEGTLVASLSGSTLTHTLEGLTPGIDHTFKVTAVNALSVAEGTESEDSNQETITPVGEPPAPTGVTVTDSSTTSNRLIVSWAAMAGISGYSIFRRVNGTDTLLGKVGPSFTSFAVDNLVNAQSYTFVVRARTTYTDTLGDGYPGNWGGPVSAAVTRAASVDSVQTVPSVAAASSVTNAMFNGTYVITAVTSTLLQYARTAANIPTRSAVGSITNLTNQTFNGTYTIATPTSTTITYAKTATNIARLGASGILANLTNQDLNGTYTVTAVNVGANQISYAKTGTDVSARAVPIHLPPGATNLITNLSNSIFNGVNLVITNVTENTFSYSKTSANVADGPAAGTVTNKTNRDVFNGLYSVVSIPAYNTVQYNRVAANVTSRFWSGSTGTISRTVSPALLSVRFRSGWAG